MMPEGKGSYEHITDLNKMLERGRYIKRHGKVVKKMKFETYTSPYTMSKAAITGTKVIFEDGYFVTFSKNIYGGFYKPSSSSKDIVGWLSNSEIKQLGLKQKIKKRK